MAWASWHPKVEARTEQRPKYYPTALVRQQLESHEQFRQMYDRTWNQVAQVHQQSDYVSSRWPAGRGQPEAGPLGPRSTHRTINFNQAAPLRGGLLTLAEEKEADFMSEAHRCEAKGSKEGSCAGGPRRRSTSEGRLPRTEFERWTRSTPRAATGTDDAGSMTFPLRPDTSRSQTFRPESSAPPKVISCRAINRRRAQGQGRR